jgi:hypothetical protein
MREPLPIDAEAVGTGLSGLGDPVAEAARRADLAALRRAIASLPAKQRDAVVLREFAGLRYDELAAALGVTEPAVESLLFRARTQLRAKLRAAYASVTGASALEWLVRAVAGGTPVAAKVAVLGVGTAAVTGSTIVVPDVVDRHRHITPTRVHHVHAARTSLPPAHAAPVTPVVVAARAQSARHTSQTIVRTDTSAQRERKRSHERHEPTAAVEPRANEGPGESSPVQPVTDSSGPGPGGDTSRSQEGGQTSSESGSSRSGASESGDDGASGEGSGDDGGGHGSDGG